MATCEICAREVEPDWKFCIGCGTPRAVADVPGAAVPSIPSAIRPDDAADARRRSRLDVPLLVGLALAAAGVALIVYLTITILRPHA